MIIVGLLWFVFVASAFLLALIILIQEGKGGGLAEAFGGQGAETFGVKATGVNRVTAILAVTFLLSSIFINKCSSSGTELDFGEPAQANTEEGSEGGGMTGTPPEDAGGGSGNGDDEDGG